MNTFQMKLKADDSVSFGAHYRASRCGLLSPNCCATELWFITKILTPLHAQLLRRIAEQDHKAVGEFYDQVAGILFSTAVRILRDKHDAEEIVQEVFVQVWGKACDFDPAMGTAIHWTLAITRHRCIDRIRSRQRRSRLVEEILR